MLVFSPVSLSAVSTRLLDSMSRYATIRCGNPLRGCLRFLRPLSFFLPAMPQLYDRRVRQAAMQLID